MHYRTSDIGDVREMVLQASYCVIADTFHFSERLTFVCQRRHFEMSQQFYITVTQGLDGKPTC